LVLLAVLIGYGARGFAGRLARGLAFATACGFEVFLALVISWENGFDVCH